MEYKIYIVRFADGSYYNGTSTQISYRKEDAKRMTWEEAENIRNRSIRIGRKNTTIESV